MPTPEQEFAASKEKTDQLAEWYVDLIRAKHPQHHYTIEPGPTHADFDYIVRRNGTVSHLLEVKTRRHQMGKYGDEKMPLRKHAVALYFLNNNPLACPTIYLVSWTNHIGIINLVEKPCRVKVQVARFDRGDATDLYAFYSVKRFKILH